MVENFIETSGRWKAYLHSLRAPHPSAEFDEAHRFLVGRDLRDPSDRTVSLALLEEMLALQVEKRNQVLADTGAPAPRPLLAWCVRGSDPESRYEPAEVAPPFALCRWAMRPDPRHSGGGGGGEGAAAAAAGAAGAGAGAGGAGRTSTSTTASEHVSQIV